MSFSKDIKQELSKISNLANKDQVKAELIGYLITNNVDINSKTVEYSTESEYNINRFAKLLNNMNISNYISINSGKKFYFIHIDNNGFVDMINVYQIDSRLNFDKYFYDKSQELLY